MKRLLMLSLFSLVLPVWSQTEQGKETSVVPREFDTYWMVFLNKGKNRERPKEEADKLQIAHLTHLKRQIDEGKMLVAGPFEVDAAYKHRGILLYPGDTPLETVQQLAGNDPAVLAGSLEVEIIKWWTPKGSVKFQKAGY